MKYLTYVAEWWNTKVQGRYCMRFHDIGTPVRRIICFEFWCFTCKASRRAAKVE